MGRKQRSARSVRRSYLGLIRQLEARETEARDEREFRAMMRAEGFTTHTLNGPDGESIVVTNLQPESRDGSDRLETQRHVKYLLHNLRKLPAQLTSLDTNRLTLLYFVVGALDLLDALHAVPDRAGIIDYVYAHQLCTPTHGGGFAGLFLGRSFDASGKSDGDSVEYERGHIAMTYVALALLAMLGDDLSRVDRAAMVQGLAKLQQSDGSFGPVAGGAETDVRFVFCACAISHMLGDWSGVDRDAAHRFLLRCQTYEGAFGQQPGQESHGGSTYCAVASLHLLGRLHDVPMRERLVQWCMHRQVGGFQGRVNKPADACYAFWVGASLAMLGVIDLADRASLEAFNFSCQNMVYGGLSKYPGYPPDPLHTYMGLAGLALQRSPGLRPLDPSLNITVHALAVFQ